jgi:site-specific recombinase XerC
MRESSEDDLGVRDVAGFVMMEEGVRREDVQGMELKKVNEEDREVVMILKL